MITRREKHFFIVAAILAIIFVITRPDPVSLQGWDYVLLFFVVGPLGFYLAHDPERRKEG